VFAGRVLHGARTPSASDGAAGAGALVSAFSLVLRRSVRGPDEDDSHRCRGLRRRLVLFGFSRWVWLSLFLMLFVGFA